MKSEKNLFQKFWNFLWVDESLLSWVVLLVLCFCFIMFVFFPVSGLIFSSKMPYVVIETGSMIHQWNFDKWWDVQGFFYENISMSKEQFKEFPYKGGLNIGDIIILKGSSDYKVGDIIVYDAQQEKPIIHRIIRIRQRCNTTEPVRDNIIKTEEVDCYIIQTKGDNNVGQLNFEYNISKEQVIGKAAFMIPKLGYVKLIPCSIFPGFCNLIDKVRS